METTQIDKIIDKLFEEKSEVINECVEQIANQLHFILLDCLYEAIIQSNPNVNDMELSFTIAKISKILNDKILEKIKEHHMQKMK